MNAISLAPGAAFTGRVARNRVRARLGAASGSAPVRRGSASAEDPDHVTRFMPIGERRHLMRVLETYAQEHRGKGGASPITASTLQVARTMLFVLMDRSSGRIDHAYSWIARHSRRVYQTACSAVHQLEQLGVLVVQRRCRRGDGPEAPPWVQDTNLYRFELPAKLVTWWNARQAAREAKTRERAPEDAIQAEEEAERRHRAYAAQREAQFEEMSKAERGAELKWVADLVRVAGAAAHAGRIGRIGKRGPS